MSIEMSNAFIEYTDVSNKLCDGDLNSKYRSNVNDFPNKIVI